MQEKIICPHAGICGGCSYQDISYEEQLAKKVNHVKELLADYADESVWEMPTESPCAYGYRNKMEFSFGDAEKDGPLTLGLHQKKSFYNVINVDDCNIVDGDFRLIRQKTLEYFQNAGVSYYHKKRQSGCLRHLVIRKAAKTGEILVMLATTSELSREVADEYCKMLQSLESGEGLVGAQDESQAGCKVESREKLGGTFAGIIHAINDLPADTVQAQEMRILYGRDYFYEEILGLKFKITPFSFFQTNSLGAEKLYSVVREYVGEVSGKKIFDLYSGTGTIAQIIAGEGCEVVGVEIVKEAVEAAKENAAANGLADCSFIAGDVFKVLDAAVKGEKIEGCDDETLCKLSAPGLIILDPPREGMTPKALGKILNYEVPQIVYVSCKPESLARDMESFRYRGYEIKRVRCVDMFPWTRHVETVAMLSGNPSP